MLTKHFNAITDMLNSRKFKRYMGLGLGIYVFSVFAMWTLMRIFSCSYFWSLAALQILIVCIGFAASKYFVFGEDQNLPDKHGERTPSESRSRDGRRHVKKHDAQIQFVLYTGVFIAFRFADWSLNLLLTGVMNIPYYFSLLTASGIIFPIKFLIYNHFIFIPPAVSGDEK